MFGLSLVAGSYLTAQTAPTTNDTVKMEFKEDEKAIYYIMLYFICFYCMR